MLCLQVVAFASMVIALTGCYSAGKMVDQNCKQHVRGSGILTSKKQMAYLKQYAEEMSSGIKSTLQKMSTNSEQGKSRWKSVCPVEKNPKKTERPSLALKVFLSFVKALKEHERKVKDSFIFYTCNEVAEILKNLTEPVCSMFSALGKEANSSVTLSSEQVSELSVTDSLTVFQTFSECVAKAKKLRHLVKCSGPVYSGCRRKGKGSKGKKGKGGNKKKGKGSRKGKKGKKGTEKS